MLNETVLQWRAGQFSAGKCYYQEASTADGKGWTVGKFIVDGKPKYLLFRGKQLMPGDYGDALSAKAEAHRLENAK